MPPGAVVVDAPTLRAGSSLDQLRTFLRTSGGRPMPLSPDVPLLP